MELEQLMGMLLGIRPRPDRRYNPVALLKSEKRSAGWNPPVEGPVAEAFDTVLAYDREFKKEMAVVIDRAGRRVLEKHGKETMVEFVDFELDRGEGGVLVHNHPLACSLSIQDLSAASSTRMSVWAVAEDGGMFYSSGFNGPPTVLIDAWAIRAGGKDFIQKFLDDGVVDEDEAALLLSHLSCLVMVREGLMKDYRFVLGSTTLKAIDKIDAAFESVWPDVFKDWEGKAVMEEG